MIFESMSTIERHKYYQTLAGQSSRWLTLPDFGALCPNPALNLVSSATIARPWPRSGIIPSGVLIP